MNWHISPVTYKVVLFNWFFQGVCKTLKSIKAALPQNTEISNSALKDVLANIGAKCRDGIVFCGKKDVNTSTALSEEELTRVEHYIFRQVDL